MEDISYSSTITVMQLKYLAFLTIKKFDVEEFAVIVINVSLQGFDFINL